MIYPEIFVIRHGQTEWNVERRHQGRLNSPLTEKGERQARDMGGMLARELADRSDVSVFSSPHVWMPPLVQVIYLAQVK